MARAFTDAEKIRYSNDYNDRSKTLADIPLAVKQKAASILSGKPLDYPGIAALTDAGLIAIAREEWQLRKKKEGGGR